jgi:murein DD-endopeptidase MepM/ murein hydrolase activator NlpD
MRTPDVIAKHLVRCLAVCALVAAMSGARADQKPLSPSRVPRSRGLYRLPFASGTRVKVFDDFTTHRPPGRVDLYAIAGNGPHKVVAAAAGRVVAIQDSYSEQQSGRAAALCHNNYVWIEHPNGEWTNYSHLAHDSVTKKAGLKVGDEVAAGQYIGDEGAVGCAMLQHVHFEVAVPDLTHPIDSGGFLIDNDGGKRELNPRFCGVPGQNALKGSVYVATACRKGGT